MPDFFYFLFFFESPPDINKTMRLCFALSNISILMSTPSIQMAISIQSSETYIVSSNVSTSGTFNTKKYSETKKTITDNKNENNFMPYNFNMDRLFCNSSVTSLLKCSILINKNALFTGNANIPIMQCINNCLTQFCGIYYKLRINSCMFAYTFSRPLIL